MVNIVRKTTAHYSRNETKHMNSLCERKAGLLHIKVHSTHSHH